MIVRQRLALIALLFICSGMTCHRSVLPESELVLEVTLNQAGQVVDQAKAAGALQIDSYNYRCAELYLMMAQEQVDKRQRDRALDLARLSIKHGERALRNASAFHPSEQ